MGKEELVYFAIAPFLYRQFNILWHLDNSHCLRLRHISEKSFYLISTAKVNHTIEILK